MVSGYVEIGGAVGTGPTGATGATGPTGGAGPTGPTGATGALVDADATTKGALKLTNDLGGAAALPTVVQLTGAAGVVSVPTARMDFGPGAPTTGRLNFAIGDKFVWDDGIGTSSLEGIQVDSGNNVIVGDIVGANSVLLKSPNAVSSLSASHTLKSANGATTWLAVDADGVNIGASVSKYGAIPATTGATMRLSKGFEVFARNVDDNGNHCVLKGDTASNTLYMATDSDFSSSKQFAIANIYPSSQLYIGVGVTTLLLATASGLQASMPTIGYTSPYGVHGTGIQAVTSGGTVVVSSSVYKYRVQRLTGVLTGINTLLLYPPATAATSYLVPFDNTTTGAFLTTIGVNDGAGGTSAVGATVALALGVSGFIMMDERGATLLAI